MVRVFSKTQPEPGFNPVIYIVINPKIFYSSFHFSSHLHLSSLQLTISLTLNLTVGPTAQPRIAALALTAVPSYLSSLTHCLTRSPLLLHLSTLSLTRPQAHNQSSTGTTLYSFNFVSYSPSPISHCRTTLYPFIFLAHGLTASLHLILHFFPSFFLGLVLLNHVSLCL